MLKRFMRYASSNILGMLALSCYILVDTYFISVAMGADGLTALNLAIPVYSFMHGLGLLLGMGGATKYAVLLGEGKADDAQALFRRMMRCTLLLVCAIMLGGMLFSGSIARLMGADARVFDMTRIYILWLTLFAPGFLLNDVLNCFVRNDGAPGLAMAAMLVSSLINIVLDYLFMFPLGMGMLGAVLATGLASVLGVMVLGLHFKKKERGLRLRGRAAAMREALRALPLGVPSMIGEVSSGVVMIVFNSILLRLAGNTGVAAYGVIANLSLVVLAVYSGLAQGAQPLVSHAKGAGNTAGMQKVLRYELIAMTMTTLAVSAGVYLFPAQITGIFNSEKSRPLQQMAETGLQLYFSGALFAGFNIVLSAWFAAAEKERPSQAISLLRGIVLIIPMAFLLSALFGMTGVWLAFPVTEGLVAAWGALLYRKSAV